MKRYRVIISWVALCMIFPISNAVPVAHAVGETVVDGAITVHSRTLDLDHTSNVVTFTGEVKAVNDEMEIRCDEMKVYYGEAAEKSAEDAAFRIERIVSTGNVHITRALGGVATAEKAVYHQAEEKMVLTGNPVVRQEKDYVQGDRIIFYIRENRSVAESAEGGKVKAVIFQRGDGK